MKFKKKVAILLGQIGLNPINFIFFLRGIPQYLYLLCKVLISPKSWKVNLFPILVDRYSEAGDINSQYFIQDLYFARKIFQNRPIRHIDIGSRIDGFLGHLLVFMDVDVLDIRPINNKVLGLNFKRADLMSDIFIADCKYPSVSCLHTIEHFGLGRYGDTYDLNGWQIGLNNLLKLVETNGLLYLSTPIGKRRIEFNAHRVFDPNELISFINNKGFCLVSFEYLDDYNNLQSDIHLDFSKIVYGCGFFVFQKID